MPAPDASRISCVVPLGRSALPSALSGCPPLPCRGLIQSRAEKCGDELRGGCEGCQAVACAHGLGDRWVPPTPTFRGSEQRFTRQGPVRPLRTDGDDEAVAIHVLCSGEDDQVHEVTNAARWAVSYTHLRAHETVLDLVCRLLLEKKKK